MTKAHLTSGNAGVSSDAGVRDHLRSGLRPGALVGQQPQAQAPVVITIAPGGSASCGQCLRVITGGETVTVLDSGAYRCCDCQPVQASRPRVPARVWRGVRLALTTVRYLVTIRRAFPWWLRVLLVIGAVQIPCLPTDELAAIVAALVLFIRYRPALRVAWRAAQLDTI